MVRLQWIISVIGVIVFAGLTAWDTQKIKEMYDPMDDGTIAGRKELTTDTTVYQHWPPTWLNVNRA
jgi:uncharacterized protein